MVVLRLERPNGHSVLVPMIDRGIIGDHYVSEFFFGDLVIRSTCNGNANVDQRIAADQTCLLSYGLFGAEANDLAQFETPPTW